MKLKKKQGATFQVTASGNSGNSSLLGTKGSKRGPNTPLSTEALQVSDRMKEPASTEDSEAPEVTESSEGTGNFAALLNSLLLQSGPPSSFVFDLDSTLFDVRPRIEKILHLLVEHPEIQKQGPSALEILRKVRIEPEDWGIRTALIRAGFEDAFPNLKETVRNHWVGHFFANHLLHLDTPYPGAQDFLKLLHERGHQIFYLTGRDQVRMKDGTIDSLRQHGFPLSNDFRELCLKPKPGESDSEFKVQFFSHLKNKFGLATTPLKTQQALGSKTVFFENEPVNIEAVRNHHPWVQLVFFKSTHSRKGTPPSDLPTIEHYLTSSDEFSEPRTLKNQSDPPKAQPKNKGRSSK